MSKSINHYEWYLEIVALIKNNDKKASELLDSKTRRFFVGLEIFKYNYAKKQYEFQDLSERDFNRIMADYFCKNMIYVFDKDNNLVYEHYRMAIIKEKFNVSYTVIRGRLANPKMYSDNYYFSYDINYKVPTPEEIEEQRKKSHETHGKYITKLAEKKVNNIINELRQNKELLVKDLKEIADYFGVKKRTMQSWSYKYDEFKKLMDDRSKLVGKPTMSRKKCDDLYSEYVKLHSESQKEGFTINNDSISQSVKTLFYKLELYEVNHTKVTFKPLIDEVEFINILAAYKGIKIIYVFDQENKLIDRGLSVKRLAKKYKISNRTITNRLNKQEMYAKDYYFSYDENFKIVGIKPNYNKEALKEANRIKAENKARKLLTLFQNDPALPYKNIYDISQIAKVPVATIYRWFKTYDFFSEYKDIERGLQNEYEGCDTEAIEKLKAEKKRKAIEKIKQEVQEKIRRAKKEKAKLDKINSYQSKLENWKDSKKVLEYAKQLEKDQNRPVKVIKGKSTIEELKARLKRL